MLRFEVIKEPLDIEKWGDYFRYFYFNEEMTFEEFLEKVEKGWIPKRHLIDWDKVQPAYTL